MSPVNFNEIASNLRAPTNQVEVDASQASQGPSLLAYRALLIGQKTVDGEADDSTLHRVTSEEDVVRLAGQGSLLHRMAIGWLSANKSTELWIGVLEDDGGGAEADGTITVSDANPSIPNAAEDGTIALYVGGVRLAVGVTEGDTPSEVATAIAAAINADLTLPVTAQAAGPVVTVTFRNAGEAGNAYDLRDSYRDGERLPAGIELAYSAMNGGTGNPDLDDLIAAMANQWFHIIAHPYTDGTNLDALEDELADRFGPSRMMDGVAFTSAVGSFANLTTLGNTRNSPHSVIVAQPGVNPLTPSFEFGPEYAGLVAKHGSIDPSRPFQTLAMRHALPPAEIDRFTYEERNLLLFEGIATSLVEVTDVQIERAITTYQRNAAGADDVAYLDVTTLLTLMYLRYDWRSLIKRRYPRHKLADDGTKFGAGQVIMTPKQGRAEAILWYDAKIEQGLCEDAAGFEERLNVERNLTDVNRLDWDLGPDLINAFVIGATKISFRL